MKKLEETEEYKKLRDEFSKYMGDSSTYKSLSEVKPHPAYWINLNRYERFYDGDIAYYCKKNGNNSE